MNFKDILIALIESFNCKSLEISSEGEERWKGGGETERKEKKKEREKQFKGYTACHRSVHLLSMCLKWAVMETGICCCSALPVPMGPMVSVKIQVFHAAWSETLAHSFPGAQSSRALLCPQSCGLCGGPDLRGCMQAIRG